VNRARDGYELSDAREGLDLGVIWGYLRSAYWSPGVPREVVERSIAGSLCLGVYARGGAQVGFARAVTDAATFAWIADVFVLEGHRRSGLGTWLIESLLAHPDLQGLRAIVLATHDAHGLYERFGFEREGERTLALRATPEQLYGNPAEKLSE
jgi:GNAT superfamily N-acetyltransferase